MIPTASPCPTPASLDRAHTLRRDAAALAELAARPDLIVLPQWRGLALMTEPPAALRVTGAAARALIGDGASFLGFEDGAPVFAVDISQVEAGEDGPDIGVGGRWRSPRILNGVMVEKDFELLAYARGLLTWQARHRFCPGCGGRLTLVDGGHVARCEGCSTSHFPRTDPAIIVLVDDGAGRVLLGRQPAWPPGMYSCLAGFVEPGETLEQAVAREVAEEAAITVQTVRYFASQPWPFPSSLMLAFTATARPDEPRCDRQELEDARWFDRDQLAAFGEWGEPGPDGLFLPRKDSIARGLITAWLATV